MGSACRLSDDLSELHEAIESEGKDLRIWLFGYGPGAIFSWEQKLNDEFCLNNMLIQGSLTFKSAFAGVSC